MKKLPKNREAIERVMGFEPTDGTLGRYCLTTWRHPLNAKIIISKKIRVNKWDFIWNSLQKG